MTSEQTQEPDEDARATSLNTSVAGVARNAAFNYVSLVLGMASSLLLTPLIYRGVGAATFGVWSVALSAVAYTGIVELGVSTATTRRVAELDVADPSRLRVVVRTAVVLHVAAGAACALLCAGLVVIFPHLFDVSGAGTRDARIAVALIGAWQVISVVSNVLTAVLFGTGRLYASTSAGMFITLALSAAQALSATLGGGLIGLSAALLASSLAQAWLLRRQVRRYHPELFGSGVRFERSEAGSLLSSSWLISVTYVAGTLGFGADVVIVGLLLSAKAAAGYAVAQKGATLARQLIDKLVAGLVATYAATGDDRQFQARIYRDAVVYSAVLALPLAAVMAMLGGPLLHAWLGPTPEGAAEVLAVLGFVLLASIPGLNAQNALLGINRTRLLAQLTVLGAVVNVPASVLLTRMHGVAGPALGSLIAVLVVDLFLLPRALARALGTKVRHLLHGVPSRLALPGLTAFGTAGLLASFEVRGVTAAMSAALVVVLSWGAWLLRGASDTDRARLRRLIDRLRARAPRLQGESIR